MGHKFMNNAILLMASALSSFDCVNPQTYDETSVYQKPW
jgi:uncharacterized protein